MRGNKLKTLSIYAIIVTYNGQRWIYKCIKSLYNSTVKLRITVIDNGSVDDTCEIINKHYPDIYIIKSTSNLGFGKANNIGLSKALNDGADYVFLLNQDAWVEPDTVEKLIENHRGFPGYGVLSPIHLNGLGDDFDYLFKSYLHQSGHDSLTLEEIKNAPSNRVLNVKMVNAAAWLLCRDVLMNIGGFNPYFHHYGEDNDYLNRCIFHGYKIGVVSNAVIYHDREQKDSENKKKQLWKRYCEVMFLNPINGKLSGHFFQAVSLILLSNTFHGKFSEVASILRASMHLLKNYRSLAHNRRALKRRRPNFISTQ